MEPLTRRKSSRPVRLTGMVTMLIVAVGPFGCVSKKFATHDNGLNGPNTSNTPSSSSWLSLDSTPKSSMPAPKGCLKTSWQGKVVYGTDQTRGGAPMPVLVGRAFLFGPDNTNSYIGDGEMIIDLFDATPRGENSVPQHIDELRIDPASLKNMASKDWFGEGYTIYYPWFTYRQDITHVYMVVAYIFPDGKRFVDASGTFSINHTETLERIRKGLTITNPAMKSAPPAPQAPAQQLPAPTPQFPAQLPAPTPQ